MQSILEPWRDARIYFYLYICDPEQLDVEAPEPLLPEHLPQLHGSGAKGVSLYVTDIYYKLESLCAEQAKLSAYGLAMLDGWCTDGTMSYLETVYYRCDDEAEVIEE